MLFRMRFGCAFAFSHSHVLYFRSRYSTETKALVSIAWLRAFECVCAGLICVVLIIFTVLSFYRLALISYVQLIRVHFQWLVTS